MFSSEDVMYMCYMLRMRSKDQVHEDLLILEACYIVRRITSLWPLYCSDLGALMLQLLFSDFTLAGEVSDSRIVPALSGYLIIPRIATDLCSWFRYFLILHFYFAALTEADALD